MVIPLSFISWSYHLPTKIYRSVFSHILKKLSLFYSKQTFITVLTRFVTVPNPQPGETSPTTTVLILFSRLCVNFLSLLIISALPTKTLFFSMLATCHSQIFIYFISLLVLVEELKSQLFSRFYKTVDSLWRPKSSYRCIK